MTSTNTAAQFLASVGEDCAENMCPASYRERELTAAKYRLSTKAEDILRQVEDMAADGRISADVAAELRQELRDALGLD